MMDSKHFPVCLCVWLVGCVAVPPHTARAAEDVHVPAGDMRNRNENIVYPAEMFLEHGGRLYNVKAPPPGRVPARGDGRTDDTRAFNDAMAFVQARFQAGGLKPEDPNHIHDKVSLCHPIYIPNGTYRVSGRIMFALNKGNPWVSNVQFIGQSRLGAVIRLTDRCPGFTDPDAPQPLIAFNRDDRNFNHWQGLCTLRNLTINTGSENRGCIAARVHGANGFSLRDLTIRSEDGNGHTAILLQIGSQHGYHCDLTVEGFRHGIRTVAGVDTYNAFEYATIRGQTECGIVHGGGGLYLRRCRVEQSAPDVPGIRLAGPDNGPQLGIYESVLINVSNSLLAAIELTRTDNQQVTARRVRCPGYRKALTVAGRSATAGPRIDFHVTGPPIALGTASTIRHLDLPVRDTPFVPWEDDLSKWHNVHDSGAVGDGRTDDTAAIQRALDAAAAAGKTVVFFPKLFYRTSRTWIRVPAGIRQIVGLNTRLRGNWYGGLEITATCADPLQVQGMYDANLRVTAKRPVIYKQSRGKLWIAGDLPAPVEIYLENGAFTRSPSDGRTESNGSVTIAELPIDHFCPPNTLMFQRGGNPEHAAGQSRAMTEVNGGTLWIFGFKTEWHGETQKTVFRVRNGGKLEVLGAELYCVARKEPVPRDMPLILVEDSQASLTLLTGLAGKQFDLIARQARNGSAYLHRRKDGLLPRRYTTDRGHVVTGNFFLPICACP
ncbi:MAG: hypothetical protein JXR37_28460 [Kiritimatiellae bacterium]|nr:hypothetical protein [Kiritimatiellia bacterium]